MTSHISFLSRIWIVAIALTLSSFSRAQTPNDAKPKPIGSISGHVLVNRKAAAGIEVAAFGGETSRRIPAAQAKTDSEGYYQLNGLAAGNYQITTFTANLTAAEANTDYPYGFGYFGSSKGILLAEGEEVTDVDIKLVRGCVITGRVTDAENKPVVEERVSLQAVSESSNRITRLPQISQMYVTDDRGVYRIYGLPAGRYKVSVGQDSAQGLVGSTNGFYQLTYYPNVTDAGHATIIDLIEGAEAKNIDIQVGRREDTYIITGRIVDSETGLPVAGVRVGMMVTKGERVSLSGMIDDPTRADGVFTVQGLTAGHYGVYVASEYGDSDYYSDPINVEVTDKDVSGVEIRAIHGLSISGSVTAENLELKDLLKQLPGLRVSANVFPADGRMTPSTIRSSGSGRVAADGKFVISGLRPGRALIGIGGSDPLKRPSIVKVTVGGVGVTQGFEIEPGQSVSGVQLLVAYGTGVVRGSVKFQGATLPEGWHVSVMCHREGTRSYAGNAVVDARGHFLVSGLAPGAYECSLQYMPFGMVAPYRPPPPQNQIVNVSNGTETELNYVVDLGPKGTGP